MHSELTRPVAMLRLEGFCCQKALNKKIVGDFSCVWVLLIYKLVGSRDFDVRGAKEDAEQG